MITNSSIVIYNPDKSVFAKGNVMTFGAELWLVTATGIRKG